MSNDCPECMPIPTEATRTLTNGRCMSCNRVVYTSRPPSLGDSLHEAHNVINGERQDSYGNPEDSFALIAEYWDAYLRKLDLPLTALDVAHLMMLFKIARCQGQAPSRDNYIDIQGYAAIAADRLLKKE